jgi:hypothetical protein
MNNTGSLETIEQEKEKKGSSALVHKYPHSQQHWLPNIDLVAAFL